MEEYDIEVYVTEFGKEPFNEWLKSFKDSKTKRIILLRIQRIRQGNFGDCKPLKAGLHELRIAYGRGLRIYFANVGSKIILLLGGGDKSTQDKDIFACTAFLEEYKRIKK